MHYLTIHQLSGEDFLFVKSMVFETADEARAALREIEKEGWGRWTAKRNDGDYLVDVFASNDFEGRLVADRDGVEKIIRRYYEPEKK